MRDDSPLRVGDRVIHLQAPGIFTVVARRGGYLEIENDRGVKMTVHEVGLRRVDGSPPQPKDV